MATIHIDDIELEDEAATQVDDAPAPAPVYLQQVVDAWEEGTRSPRAEAACTAAVADWEENHP
jgi:hypothetical protein